MVLPLTYKRNTNEELISPDNLPVPRGMQSQLIFNKTVETDTLASFLIRKAQEAFDAATHKNANSPILSAQEANTKYGIKDRLDFKENVSEAEAKAKFDRFNRAQEIERQLALADEQNTLGDKATNLMLGFAGNAPDIPLYALIPEAGVLRGAQVLRLAKYSKTVAAAIRNPISRAMIAEGIENTAAQPIIASNYKYYGLNYGIEDAVADVMFGTVLGAGVGAARAHVGGNILLAKRKAREINLTNAKPYLSVLDDAMRGHGTGDTFNTIQSIVKLQNSIELRRLDGDSLYRSDFVYRSDLNDLSPEMKVEVNTRALNEPLIPKAQSDFGAKVTSKLDTDGNVKLGDLANVLKEKFPNLSKKQIKQMVNDELGTKSNSNTSTIKGDDAVALADALDRKSKREANLKTEQTEDVIPLLTALKEKIAKLSDITNKSLDEFITSFKEAKAKVLKSKKLQDAKIQDLDKLSEAEQQTLLEYLRFFQEGNLQRSEINALEAGDKQAFADLQERMRYNRQYLDSIGADKAYATARDALARPDLPNIEAIKPSPLNKYVDADFSVKQQIIDEEIETYRYKLTDEEFEGFQKEAAEETNKLIDDKAEALDVTTQCMLRGGL